MRPTVLVPAMLSFTALFACAGTGSGQVVAIDYSAIDGVSCMVDKSEGWTLLKLDKDYDASECGPRTRDGYVTEQARPDGFRDQCALRWGAECCTQVGAVHVGWAEASDTASPLCRF